MGSARWLMFGWLRSEQQKKTITMQKVAGCTRMHNTSFNGIYSTWNLVTHSELQKLKTFPSGRVA